MEKQKKESQKSIKKHHLHWQKTNCFCYRLLDLEKDLRL